MIQSTNACCCCRERLAGTIEENTVFDCARAEDWRQPAVIATKTEFMVSEHLYEPAAKVHLALDARYRISKHQTRVARIKIKRERR